MKEIAYLTSMSITRRTGNPCSVVRSIIAPAVREVRGTTVKIPLASRSVWGKRGDAGERHHPKHTAEMHAEVEFWNNCFDERSEGKKLARNQAADELSTRAEALNSLRAYDELWKPETFIERKLKRTLSEYNSQNAEAIVHAYNSNSDSDEMLDALASPRQEERVLQAQRFVLEGKGSPEETSVRIRVRK